MILVHVTTVPETLNFFRGQIGFMKENGFEVHAISSPGESLKRLGAREAIPTHSVEMSRQITPFQDLAALSKLVYLFHKLKPTIVHAHTPKGGLLGTLAACVSHVPIIVYTMHGLPFVTGKGVKRTILYLTETIACRAAHQVLAVSVSNRQRAIADRVCSDAKIRVLAHGSCNGVDAMGRFNPRRLAPESREGLRTLYQIPSKALVLAYMGRIVRDKGIIELAGAWQILRQKFPDLYLWLIGPEEKQDPIPAEVSTRLKSDPRVRFTNGFVDDPVPFYGAMDIMVLPTYREGFPVTPLEASAMQIPVVATTVDGCPEAVADGETGILVLPRNIFALTNAIESLVLRQDLRRLMGLAGRERVLRYFTPQLIWKSLYQMYFEQLQLRLKV